jgi:endonuclease G
MMHTGFLKCVFLILVFTFSSALLMGQNEVFIQHPGYSVLYSRSLKAPLVVQWTLTKKDLVCSLKFKRKNLKFHNDPNYPEAGDMTTDYRKSGFDKGHMCPAADRACSETSLFDTFCYTNCTMQRPGLNRIKWEQLESATRKWVLEGHDSLILFSGPIFGKAPEYMGVHNVAIPIAFYKIIFEPQSGKSVSYIMQNTKCDLKLNEYATTLTDVEIKSGLRFPSLTGYRMKCDTAYFK